MTDDAGTEQIAYYRARAVEYDADAYGPEAPALISQAVEQVPVGSDLLELACGTGVWTQRLVHRAATVTAVDAAPEMLELARARAPQATFIRADLLAWKPPRRFHTIFFAFWLSHIPGGSVATFWNTVADALLDGGRVVFVDEHVSAADHETWLAEHIVQRKLSDGSTYRVVKTFLDPQPLTDQLAELGWRADVHRLGTRWVLGTATRM